MIHAFSDIDEDEYPGIYGDEEITQEIIRTKQSKLKNYDG